MAQFIEFIGNHWLLSGIWVLLALMLLGYQRASGGTSVSPQQATNMVNRENAALLDIRERKDFDKGHIVNAINIPLAKLPDRMTELEKYKDVPIIVVCNMGNQAGDAVIKLKAAGYTQACRMKGGMTEWRSLSLPVVA